MIQAQGSNDNDDDEKEGKSTFKMENKILTVLDEERDPYSL